ncbi:ROK family transcriptional regulator [Aquibacillus salsiterrae]|uniref:ROK family transcriptional regulator n=1 Tax=Aquibacillus salsiterrae TaxID=2950439 RepID=A0A9X3WBV3_9BACI|nr:ROK family transcriptional regulator [Aquibacillus salsiterrae]MDC3416840.1 ROK family transcriptional regulator [Aquibacillus salsiterrae]
MQRGSFQWMKSLNKSIILNKIRISGPISRAQIAKETKLTPPTVGSIVKELIEQTIVKESELGQSQGGRKPTMLMINHSEFYVIGIDVGPQTVEFILTDLVGDIKEVLVKPVLHHVTNQQFLELLKAGINELINQFIKLKDKIIGIGVAMHGVVDVEAGMSLYAPNLNLRHVPIKEELENTFDYVVKVENDARSMALGEAWFGGHEEEANMMVINIGTGVGAGLVIDGKLYHGEYDIAGEVGHMTIDINGQKCECGNYGCLQTIISGPAIAERARQAAKSRDSSVLFELVEGDLSEMTGEFVYQAALKHDQLALSIFEEVGGFIGIGLTNLIHIINPCKIIIGGGVANAEAFLLEPIRQTIRKRALTDRAKETEVVFSRLGEHATSLGAVALVLVELFKPNLSE